MTSTALRYRVRPIELELKHTFRLSRGASDRRHNLVVEIESEGLVGYGEAAPIPRYAQDAESAHRAIDQMLSALQDPIDFEPELSRVAVADQPAAVAAVDMALRDLQAKRQGVPWYQTQGLDPETIQPTSFTIGLDCPEVVVQKVREAAGFHALKVKMGLDNDREILAAARRATDQRLRVDANEGWTLHDAQQRLDQLVELGVELVEQPLPAGELAAMRELKRTSPLPLFADESVQSLEDIPRLAEAFDGVNIKLMKCGGMGPALEMIAAARRHGLQVMLGCMVESSLGISAAVQLSPLVDFVDLDGNLLIRNDPFGGLELHAGRLLPSGQPGLGVWPLDAAPRQGCTA